MTNLTDFFLVFHVDRLTLIGRPVPPHYGGTNGHGDEEALAVDQGRGKTHGLQDLSNETRRRAELVNQRCNWRCKTLTNNKEKQHGRWVLMNKTNSYIC